MGLAPCPLNWKVHNEVHTPRGDMMKRSSHPHLCLWTTVHTHPLPWRGGGKWFNSRVLKSRKPKYFKKKSEGDRNHTMANLLTPKKRDNLSQLERCILSLGKQKGSTVLARDVLIEYYDFTPIRDPSGLKAGAIVFRKSDIGVGRYNSASVAVCKAFNRLVRRGMATRIFSGIRLNGRKVAG